MRIFWNPPQVVFFPDVTPALLSFASLPSLSSLHLFSLIIRSSFPWLWSFSLVVHSPLSLHHGRSNWRSAFQWKPLINTNLHLKCNLILTAYVLSVNWIPHLKDKEGGVGDGARFKARFNRSALASKSQLPLIYIHHCGGHRDWTKSFTETCEKGRSSGPLYMKPDVSLNRCTWMRTRVMCKSLT